MSPQPAVLRQETLADAETLARRVAAWLLDLALASTGDFSIALSGGSTPKRLYEILAGPPYRGGFPWQRTHLFWGDERFVSHDDSRSNFHMTSVALLSRAPIPPGNVHAVPVQGVSPIAAAAAYETELRRFHGPEALSALQPLFDVTLLGLGTDGHTASLFPGTAALDERERWVLAVEGVKAEPRITLTYPALESSRNTAFLVAGADKRVMLGRLLQRDAALPAARLSPTGAVTIFADRAAAG